jgi:hypothetical protein
MRLEVGELFAWSIGDVHADFLNLLEECRVIGQKISPIFHNAPVSPVP